MNKRLNKRWQSSLLATIAIILALGALDATVAQEKKSIGKEYGSREPQTCEDTTAPAKGAITAALAKQYFICGAESVFGRNLYLVEDVKVQVGAGRPFNEDVFDDIDPRFPIYPIRGSFTRYQCEAENTNPRFPINVGKNCNTYEKPKASGICYKTTFGDWKCTMSDNTSSSDDNRTGVAPPQP